MYFVPCGDDVLGVSREPALLSESSLTQALHHWQDKFEHILIDAGTCGSMLLAPLARRSQTAVLLVPFQLHDVEPIARASERLATASSHVAGCLLTGFPVTN
jgi:hypothetical protein